MCIIEQFRADNNLSIFEFCKKCKIDIVDYEKILVQGLDIDIMVVFKIAKVMGIHVCNLFVA